MERARKQEGMTKTSYRILMIDGAKTRRTEVPAKELTSPTPVNSTRPMESDSDEALSNQVVPSPSARRTKSVPFVEAR